MGIKRYIANKDTTISNAYMANLRTRATGSNMGASDVLETFSLYAQASSASVEKQRILVEFPIDDIISDRSNGNIPASGTVNFRMSLYNVAHGETLPNNFTLVVAPISKSWEEGYGLDMEDYSDLTKDGIGANWINAASGSTWSVEGGDYITGTYTPGSSLPHFTQSFDSGLEDLDVDITSLVEEWIAGTSPNYGIGVFLTSSQESGQQQRSYYTKKFSARRSEFFFSRPRIEARWDSTLKDNRGNFNISSSLLSSADNTNTIYLYNYVRNELKDIPNISQGDPIFVTLHTSASEGSQLSTSPTPITGGWVSTGIYSASFALNTTASVVYDRWFSGSTYYYTGSFEPIQHDASDNILVYQEYVSNISNLKSIYSSEEIARFRLFVRLKNLNPTIFTIAQASAENNIIEDAYYKIFRMVDKYEVIPYGTGSVNHTRLSYDKDGNYFDLDMSMLQADYGYGIKLLYRINGRLEEQPETFRFRIESSGV